jgi:hypothetical protein
VQVCPTGALRAVRQDDAAMREQAHTESLAVLRPELGTRPRVYYRNLDRFSRCFIGASVVAEIEGVTECVAGAVAVVRKDGTEVARATSDAFGDIKFDGFEQDSGLYTVEIEHPRLGAAIASCVLGDSVYLGTLLLAPAPRAAAPTPVDAIAGVA